MSGYNGTLKVYPDAEMLAIDMAEALRAIATFNGIIQGCRLSLSGGTLHMTSGRVLMGGRLGIFEPAEGQSDITIELPTVSADDTGLFICIVCDLGDSNRPLYVDLLDTNGYTAKNTASTSESFNVENRSIALKIGRVTISRAGVATNLQRYETAPTTYPDGKIKTDKDYVDALAKVENDHYLLWNDWKSFLDSARHKSGFFTKMDIVANGLELAAGEIRTFQFRPEYESQVVIKPTSGTAPSRPSDKPYVYINPDGTFVNTSPNQSAGPLPNAERTTTSRGVRNSLNNAQKNMGVTCIRIENASTGGMQGDKCYVQSYYFARSGTSNTEYLFVKIRNTATSAAKIKLTLTCSYVRNIDF